jgi:hypothetical protein
MYEGIYGLLGNRDSDASSDLGNLSYQDFLDDFPIHETPRRVEDHNYISLSGNAEHATQKGKWRQQ